MPDDVAVPSRPTSSDAAEHGSEATEARASAAAALRRLGHALMRREADPDLLYRVAEAADRTTVLLEDAPPRHRDPSRLRRQFFPDHVDDGAPIAHFDECFVSGRHNPLGVGMLAARDGDGVTAEVVLGAAFEGAPGRAHGGIVAALCDDVMGYLLSVHTVAAFTGELTVRYLAPTPVETPLTLRARVVHRDGRRLLAEAEIIADGRRVATAAGTFVEVDPRRFRA